MYAEYYKERQGFDTLETESGFCTYKIYGDELYIKDIFILKQFRRSGEAFKIGELMTEIAKANDCKRLTGSVVPNLNGSTESMAGLIKFGFKLHSSAENFISLVKEI